MELWIRVYICVAARDVWKQASWNYSAEITQVTADGQNNVEHLRVLFYYQNLGGAMPNDYSSDPPVATAGQLIVISDKINDISKNYACLPTFIYNKSKEYVAY